jgi:hypothetical protein
VAVLPLTHIAPSSYVTIARFLHHPLLEPKFSKTILNHAKDDQAVISINPQIAPNFVAPKDKNGPSAPIRRHTAANSGAPISSDLTMKGAELASHLLAANAAREVKTNGTSLTLIRCPRCAHEFAREPDQSAWRAVHVGVFRVEFLGPSEREHS